MPSLAIFPLEIEEIILDRLAEDDKDHLALKMCSLVCQAFLPICRKHIFESIRVAHASDDHNLPVTSSPTIVTIHAFERLLRETPEIADYIRKSDFCIRNADLTRPSIQESLKRISRLKFFTLRRHNVQRGTGFLPCSVPCIHVHDMVPWHGHWFFTVRCTVQSHGKHASMVPWHAFYT